MTTPTTLPDALTQIEELRGQVHDLLQLLGQEAQRETGADGQTNHRPVTQNQTRDRLLREIVEGTAASTGHAFFRSLVQHLAKALNVRYAFVGERHKDRPNSMRILAVWSGTELGEPFDCDLKGTPCINVINQTFCFYPNTVQQLFPEDRLLAEMRVESYCGMPIFGQSSDPLGILVVMDDQPMTDSTIVKDLLDIFAARAAAELERARAEQEGIQTLADLHNVMETIPDILVTLDLQGNLVRWNHRLERVTGYSEKELLNKHALEFVPPSEHERTAAAIQRAFRDGYAELEGHLLTKDGRTIPYHWTGATLTDHQGHIIGLTGVGRDISERKQTESALQQSEAHFRALIEHSSDIITVLDLDGRIRFESPSFERLLGYVQHELDGLIAFDFIHPNDLPTVLEKFQLAVQRPGEAQTAEFRFRHKDGSWLILEGIGRSILNTAGRRCVIVNSRDVTERRRVAHALAQRSLQQQVIAEFGEFALRKRAVQSVMDQAVQRIAQTLHTEYCKVLELQPGGTSFLLRAGVGWHDGLVGRATVHAGSESQAGYTLNSNEPVIVENLEADLRFNGPPLLFDHGVVSGLSVIIRRERQPWGVLGIHTSARRSFTQDDVNFVQSMANILGTIVERDLVEQAARRDHVLLSAIMDASIDHISVKDLDGRYIHMNRTGANALGMPSDEIIGWDDVALWGSESAASLRAGDRRVVESGETITAEESFTGEGKATVYLTTKAPYRDPEGRIIGVIRVARDISERKQAEEALRQSEARLNEAQRRAHLGSWELELTTNRLTWSDEIYRIFELDRKRFGASYETFLSAVHPEDREAVDQAYTQSVQMKTPYEITYRLRMPDGRVKYVQERGETFSNASGAPLRSVGTVQDVTEATLLSQRETVRLKQLQTLSELGLTLSGDPADIFERIVRMIGELFHVRVVCLSEIVGDDLQFRAIYSNGEVWRDAGHCPLAVTPCATVEITKDLRLFDHVMERFPQATFLRDHRAVAYCGFPALDAQGQVVAVTCLLDDKPREFTGEEQALLRVFGQRIAMEIERARYLTNQRRQAEVLQRSHAFLRQIIDIAPNFIFAKDRAGRFTLANQAMAEALGTTVEHLIGKTKADFHLKAEEIAVFNEQDLEVRDSGKDLFILEEPFTDTRGHTRWLQTIKRPLFVHEGQAAMVLGVATDITERKRMEEVLRQRERDLQQAIEERQRISEDLHDGILQSIFAVGLGLESCRTLVSELPLPRKKTTAPLTAALNRAIGQLNHVMAEVRSFIAGIESHVLQGGDVGSSLRAMVQGMCISNGTAWRVTIEEAAVQEVSTEQAYHVMNIVREALSNSLRHSGARRIALSFKRLRRSLRLAVTDDGKGFNPHSVRDVGHGLANMATRARKLGGRVEVHSRPRQGTKVLLDMPRRPADE